MASTKRPPVLPLPPTAITSSQRMGFNDATAAPSAPSGMLLLVHAQALQARYINVASRKAGGGAWGKQKHAGPGAGMSFRCTAAPSTSHHLAGQEGGTVTSIYLHATPTYSPRTMKSTAHRGPATTLHARHPSCWRDYLPAHANDQVLGDMA